MTGSDTLDDRLTALLADRAPAPADEAFAERVVALAAYDQRIRQAQRRGIARVGREALALVAILGCFVGLARAAPEAAGLGETIPLASPAMLGLLMLALWLLISLRSGNAFAEGKA